MANTFLMNEVPLPVSHFLYFDLLPLGFNEQELSRKARRISVICNLSRGELKVCVCVHMPSCVQMCACTCTHKCIRLVHTHVLVCAFVRAPVSTCLYEPAARSYVDLVPSRCLQRHVGYCLGITVTTIADVYEVPCFRHCSYNI